MDKKAIWIDVDNSPHVPLFVPIIRHYRENGVDVVLTARDHSQTIELLDLAGLSGTYQVVGRHYGKSKINKIQGLVRRAAQLFSYVRTRRIAVAISHGSRSMVLAARGSGIPVLTMYDYEFTETRIFNRFSNKVLIPNRIPDSVLEEIGLPSNKRKKYPGIKEELYVRSFEASADFRQRFAAEHNLSADGVFAVLRPPATSANYHSEKSEVLLDDILHFLLNADGVVTIVVPRTSAQADDLKKRIKNAPEIGEHLVLGKAVDGLQLASASDMLISGGGTMNREAALLGVPVYSIFAGRQGALDRQMEREGLITFIRDARDLSKIRLERRLKTQTPQLTDRVERFVIAEIDTYL
jgi:predicted glycosyltransferase